MSISRFPEMAKFIITRGEDFDRGFSDYKNGKIGKKTAQFLRDPKFTIKDTGLNYRTINHWDSLGLLLGEKKNDTKWRKFGLLDLYWLGMVDVLRDYGFPIHKIKIVKEYLFEQRPNDKPYPIFEYYLSLFLDHADEYYIIVLSDGQADIGFKDEIDETNFLWGLSDYICINLMSVSEKIFEFKDKRNYQKLPIYLSPKEKSLLEDVRSGRFSSINIKLITGKIERLEKTENIGAVEKSIEKLKEIMESKSYQKITVEMEDGKTVNIQRTIKEK